MSDKLEHYIEILNESIITDKFGNPISSDDLIEVLINLSKDKLLESSVMHKEEAKRLIIALNYAAEDFKTIAESIDWAQPETIKLICKRGEDASRKAIFGIQNQ